jgi:hypothetical protein
MLRSSLVAALAVSASAASAVELFDPLSPGAVMAAASQKDGLPDDAAIRRAPRFSFEVANLPARHDLPRGNVENQPEPFDPSAPIAANLPELADPLTATVPEPGTWAMLIAGFGLVGWAARRRARGLA